MNKWTNISRFVALPAVAVAAAVGVTAPAEAASSHGCPSGYVCIYPQNAGWNNNKPEQPLYYRYGWYNLHGQLGTHRVFDNQTGGASVFLCYGYGGTGGYATQIPAPRVQDLNLTPINSIVLTPTTSASPSPCASHPTPS